MTKARVLFICGQNSGRSQMAEAFLKDPEELTGTHEEKLESLREIRNQIREKIIDWFITLS